MENVWKRTIASLSSRIEPRDLAEYVSRLQPVSQRQSCLVVEAPSRLAAEVVQQRYLAELESALARESEGSLARITLQVRQLSQQELFPSPPKHEPPTPTAIDRASLQPNYTFGTFVVGTSNQFAHAAAKAVANQPGDHYNPLFIYGGVGLGKTHLVNAIGHQVLDRKTGSRVIYLSSESFMNELIAALRRDRMSEFKNRFRHIDVLILDDVQFLAGRERTQEEFFHTFNSLYESHRQIVLTSDLFPKEIPDLEERLRNRFEWGLIADIQAPDLETRVAILQRKAEFERLTLPHDVALFLASNISSNVRELEGSLTRLGAFASLNKSHITVEFAREVLQNVLSDRTVRGITLESIEKTVCDFFHVRPHDLRSRKRTRTIALPRQIAMYICRRHTTASFPTIGDRFGGRDHSTVIHAVNVVARRVREDPRFRDTIEQLERLLERTP